MLPYLKWAALASVALLFAGFLHYSLPDDDIVRIIGTEIARVAVETKDERGGVVSRTRDVRYIKAISPSGKARVYRNEDTGWGWPPYFKFDSADLTTRADDAASTAEEPQWYAVRHYGWRITWMTVFPNAVSVRPVTGPNESIVPWFNILVLLLLAVLAVFARHHLMRLYRMLRGLPAEG